jgi:hypothetical protein
MYNPSVFEKSSRKPYPFKSRHIVWTDAVGSIAFAPIENGYHKGSDMKTWKTFPDFQSAADYVDKVKSSNN